MYLLKFDYFFPQVFRYLITNNVLGTETSEIEIIFSKKELLSTVIDFWIFSPKILIILKKNFFITLVLEKVHFFDFTFWKFQFC